MRLAAFLYFLFYTVDVPRVLRNITRSNDRGNFYEESVGAGIRDSPNRDGGSDRTSFREFEI